LCSLVVEAVEQCGQPVDVEAQLVEQLVGIGVLVIALRDEDVRLDGRDPGSSSASARSMTTR
jgi:hypothetical protein